MSHYYLHNAHFDLYTNKRNEEMSFLEKKLNWRKTLQNEGI